MPLRLAASISRAWAAIEIIATIDKTIFACFTSMALPIFGVGTGTPDVLLQLGHFGVVQDPGSFSALVLFSGIECRQHLQQLAINELGLL